jgi:ABC-type glycerol-3-phosphate transport system permease component
MEIRYDQEKNPRYKIPFIFLLDRPCLHHDLSAPVMIGAAFKSNEEIFGTIGLLPKNPMFGAFAAGWKGTGQYGFSTFLYNTFLMVIPTVVFTAGHATT